MYLEASGECGVELGKLVKSNMELLTRSYSMHS